MPYLYKNGGIGTCSWHLANLLGREGWRVHLLYCGPTPDPEGLGQATCCLAQDGCSLSVLDTYDLPTEARVASCFPGWFLEQSDRIRHALQALHRAHHFSLIEFADYQGLGFRPIQAKRTGLAFEDVCMIVKLHSSSQWVREANLQWVSNLEDLLLDHCERYAFDHADVQLAPCRYMLDYARSIGWNVHDDARVVPYVFPRPEAPFPPRLAAISEVVFFGRLETRKGLEVFLDAVERLPVSLPVTFLGKETILSDGQSATQLIKERLQGRPVTLLPALDRQEALAYLRQGSRLAVMPSLLDNSPNTVIECATHGIPFLAAHTGGIPELLPDPELQSELLFEPNATALQKRLTHYLGLPPASQQALVERAREVTDPSQNNKEVLQEYHRLIQEKILPTLTPAAPAPLRLAEAEPLVTVAVTYYNLPQLLPETLASLAAQTYDNLEVLVVDDGSTSPVAVRVFEEQQQLYPQFRFLSQPNAGLSAARNFALAEASGEYFLPVDADNLAAPHMVATFVHALRRNPDVSALACYFLAFEDSADVEQEKFVYAYRPTAGPHLMASFRNVYGDANAIFRTADLRAVNGYEPERDSTCEDWEAFVKLVHAGYRLDVIPEHLFYYRHRPQSLLRNTHPYRNQLRVLRHYFQPHQLPRSEQIGLWSALGRTHLPAPPSPPSPRKCKPLRHLVADRLNRVLTMVPPIHFLLRQAILTLWINPDLIDDASGKDEEGVRGQGAGVREKTQG